MKKTQNKKPKSTVLAFTTDPYDALYGYALVFFKLFDYIDKSSDNLNLVFAANNGNCSRLVKNKNFVIKKMSKNSNLALKTLYLAVFFLRIGLSHPKKSIVIANCEIPELLAAWILKFRNEKVLCILQDDRVRGNSLYNKLVCRLRIFLLNRIKNVIFTNEFTMNKFEGSVNKFYLGNPIF